MRNIPLKITGDSLTADEFNDILSELKNAITLTGQTLTSGDLYQLAKTISVYVAVGDFYTDSGAANAYVLGAVTPLMAPIQLRDGFRARFKVAHSNTTSSTANVVGTGIKPILRSDGITALSAGDLTSGKHAEIIYHVDLGSWVLQGTDVTNPFPVGLNAWSDSSAAWTGWILVNDNTKTTIGDASSAATIRANADCENLFLLYWTYSDTDCPVTGGRGGTAAADWAAHKKIAIPSAFRRVFAAHDINDTLRIGQVEGDKTVGLIEANNGAHVHAVSDPRHQHQTQYRLDQYQSGDSNPIWHGDQLIWTTLNSTGISIVSSGSGTPHANVQPTVHKNLYIKL